MQPPVNKILIIQTAFIGDVVLATPLAEAAHQAFPGSRIDFMVIPVAANLLERNPFINRVVIFDKRHKQRGVAALFKLAADLHSESYDLALIPHRSLRSAVLVWLARIPLRIGFKNSAGARLFTHRVPYRQKHEVERNLDLLHAVKDSIDAPMPKVMWDQFDLRAIAPFCNGAVSQRWYCALAPGSVWATKRWPVERFTELARRLIIETGAWIFLIGGAADAELCMQIAEEIGGQCTNTAGQLTLRQSAALLDRCQLLISNDSAPTHLAVATRCKVMTIFGPTVPAFGFAPFGDGHLVIEKNLSCRPCSRHGSRRCPLGTHACMQEISVDEVFAQASMVRDLTKNRSELLSNA